MNNYDKNPYKPPEMLFQTHQDRKLKLLENLQETLVKQAALEPELFDKYFDGYMKVHAETEALRAEMVTMHNELKGMFKSDG